MAKRIFLIPCLLLLLNISEASAQLCDYEYTISPKGELLFGKELSELEKQKCIAGSYKAQLNELEKRIEEPATRICLAAAKGTKTAVGIGGFFAFLSVFGLLVARRKSIAPGLKSWADSLSGLARVWYLLGLGAICARAYFIVFLLPPFGGPSSALFTEIFVIGLVFWLIHSVSRWVYEGFKKRGVV